MHNYCRHLQTRNMVKHMRIFCVSDWNLMTSHHSITFTRHGTLVALVITIKRFETMSVTYWLFGIFVCLSHLLVYLLFIPPVCIQAGPKRKPLPSYQYIAQLYFESNFSANDALGNYKLGVCLKCSLRDKLYNAVGYCA